MIDIATHIGKKLRTVCPNVKIYRNEVDGGAELPSFLLQKIGTKRTPLLGLDQARVYSYSLVYFPEDEDSPSAELEAMDDQLLDNLTALDEFARVSNLSTNIVDKTLVATFDVFITARYSADIEHINNVKIGDVNNGRSQG